MHSVRVLGCNREGGSSNIDIIAALEWTIRNHRKPAIINMSLGPVLNEKTGEYPARSAPFDAAVQSAIRAGITVIVAAGNDGLNACETSPAGTEGVISVGATTRKDTRAPFSNVGSCVSVFAPGMDIISAVPEAKYDRLDGTSQASPFVAGVAALLLQQRPDASPQDVTKAIQSAAVRGAINEVGPQSPNLLLQLVRFTDGAREPGVIEFDAMNTSKSIDQCRVTTRSPRRWRGACFDWRVSPMGAVYNSWRGCRSAHAGRIFGGYAKAPLPKEAASHRQNNDRTRPGPSNSCTNCSTCSACACISAASFKSVYNGVACAEPCPETKQATSTNRSSTFAYACGYFIAQST